MSSKVQAAVWARYPVGGGEMLLALALADHADDQGRNIWPSVAYSAEKTRQSERSVQYQLRRMVQRGFLILAQEAKHGRTREYKISPEWLAGGELREPIGDHVPDAGSMGEWFAAGGGGLLIAGHVPPQGRTEWTAAGGNSPAGRHVPTECSPERNSSAPAGRHVPVEGFETELVLASDGGAPANTDVPIVGEKAAPMLVDKSSSARKGGCNPRQKGVQPEVGGGAIGDIKHVVDCTPIGINHHEKVLNLSPPVDNSARIFSVRTMFEIFLREYPRQEKRAQAWMAFDQLRPDMETFGWMIRALWVQRKTRAWNDEGGRWIPFPERWLNESRWKSWKSVRVDQDGQWLRILLAMYSPSEPERKPAGSVVQECLTEMRTMTRG